MTDPRTIALVGAALGASVLAKQGPAGIIGGALLGYVAGSYLAPSLAASLDASLAPAASDGGAGRVYDALAAQRSYTASSGPKYSGIEDAIASEGML